MVELRKKSGAAFTPINPVTIISGLAGIAILVETVPDPAKTVQPSNLTVSVGHS